MHILPTSVDRISAVGAANLTLHNAATHTSSRLDNRSPPLRPPPTYTPSKNVPLPLGHPRRPSPPPSAAAASRTAPTDDVSPTSFPR